MSEALKNYNSLKGMSEIELENVLTKYKAAQGALKSEALQKLPLARKAYFDAVNETSFKVFVQGEPDLVKQFIERSRQVEMICLDAMDFYRKVGSRAVGSIGPSRTFGSTQLALLINDIREWIYDHKQDLPLTREPTLETLFQLPDDEAANGLVRDLIRTAAGDTYNILSMRETMTQIGLAGGYTQSVTPILIFGFGSPEEKAALETVVDGRIFSVDATEKNVTPDGHLKVLSAIKVELMKKQQK